jgi:hydrophobe/amphiphile efflux-1 (HAE1) family protein
MNLSEICIKRPVLAIVLSLVLVVIGVMGYTYLDTRFFPKFEQNSINISTNYPGASAKLVESSVTTPLEEAISGVQGIDTIQSQSYQGASLISLTLKSKVDVYQTANQLRDKVELARSQLPSNLDAPQVQVGYGDMELMDVGFIDPNQSVYMIRDYLDRYVTNQVEQVPGVANVQTVGANPYAMRIWLDPQKMTTLGISVNDVEMAIKNSNVELPAGVIKGNSIDYPITAQTKLSSAAEFNNIIIKNIDGNIVRIKDIGNAALGQDAGDDTIVRINGQPGVFLSINNATDANPIDAARGVNHLLDQIQQQLPPSMKIVHSFDISNYMNESVHEVYISIVISILCVTAVIFLFLGQWRTVLIPIATIPVCLIATFGFMYLMGFSINVITLLALVLSIGLVVDDAIVMLENIYRHIEQGTKPFLAAIQGSKEITFAVIAMTITLAAVYAPIGLMQNQASSIFQSFAFTLAGAVLISGFVALTLSPMMCARLLKNSGKQTQGYGYWVELFYEHLTAAYQKFLSIILKKRFIVVIAAILIAIGGFFLIKNIPMAFVPQEDMGLIVTSINSPTGASIDTYTNRLQQVSDIFLQNPDVASIIAIADTNPRSFNGVFATLKPYKQRQFTAEQVATSVNQAVKQTPGLDASSFPPSFGGSMQSQIEFSLIGSGTYMDLYNSSQLLIDKLKQYPGLHDVQSNIKFDSQQYNMTVNRELAGKLQVNINDIDNTMAALLGGSNISTFDMDGKTYNVYVQAQQTDLHNLNSINEFYVNNSQNKLIPLTNLINIQPTLSQVVLPHFNRLRSAQVTAQLAPGYGLGTVVQYLQTELPKILPSDVKYAFTGSADNLLNSNSSMGLIFLLAIIFIYLVLAAQFESFVDPFIILLAVPLSIVGALLSLKLIGGSMNIYTDIGLVTLIGLVSKHGILITQFANKLQEQGLSMQEALIKAASTRLRPIIMTTAAMIFGALPLLFSGGASGESRRQIGMVIIGGLFFGTFFSLVVVPVTYSYANKLKQLLKRKKLPITS